MSRRNYDREEATRMREERDALYKVAMVWWRGRRPVGWTDEQHRAQPFVNLTIDAEKPLAAMLAAWGTGTPSPKRRLRLVKGRAPR